MRELGKLEHHNEIGFYVRDELCLKGEILIDNKHYCEGIVTDNDNNKYFIFGIFVKCDYLELYVVNNIGEVYDYCATKGYLKYNGNVFKVDGSIVSEFYLKVRGLDVDPRDYGKDNPKYLFERELKVFKENWLLDVNNNSIYENSFFNKMR